MYALGFTLRHIATMRTAAYPLLLVVGFMASIASAFLGCGTESEGITSPPGQVIRQVAVVDDNENEVRWASGFGFRYGGEVLWLAHDGDTTWWVHSGAIAPVNRCTVLPESKHIALATWSTTHVPFVRASGALDQWTASGYLDRVDAASDAGRVSLGGDAGLDEERLLASGADVLTSYPFGDPMMGVEERTGIPVMALAEYAETHPLGRAEFIKVFGWLTGRLEEAKSAFEEVETAYVQVRDAGLKAARTEGRPVVFAGSSQGGKWTAPGPDGLVAKLLEDAGGAYAFGEGRTISLGLKMVGSNFEVETEQCALIAADCDAFGKVVFAPEGWRVSDAVAEAPWFDFQDRMAFHCNTAEVDYFGEAIMEPHEMLADLVHLFHPSCGARDFVYFQPTLP